MIDSIFIAMSGLRGHERGLDVISHNVANMNTPGFKGSSVDFADVFCGEQGDGRDAPAGGGLDASRTTLDLRAGEHAIDPLPVYDRLGGVHNLRLAFARDSGGGFERWTLRASEAGRELDTASLEFVGGRPPGGASTLRLSLGLAQAEAIEVDFVFGSEVTSFSSGTTSTLAVEGQDGHAPGTISGLAFDATGHLKVAYSNGKSAEGAQIALAELRDEAAVRPIGDGLLAYAGAEPVALRTAGEDLRVAGQSLELSNVDLTREFGALILMQRGY